MNVRPGTAQYEWNANDAETYHRVRTVRRGDEASSFRRESV
jgi:hypothetical protein